MKYFLSAFIIIVLTNSAYSASCSSNQNFRELKSLRAQCASKSVHLTFDDGPDPKVTPRILSSLNRKKVKASFYVSTTNLKPGEKNETLISMIRTGHVVASHGHEHKAHDLRVIGSKCDPHILTASQSERQIERSLSLLQSATAGLFNRQPHKLFRFPYGRGASPSAKELGLMLRHGQSKSACSSKRLKHAAPLERESYKQSIQEYRRFKSKALQRVHESSRDHVGWNFDSGDSNPNVAKKAKSNPDWYVKRTLKNMCQSRSNVLIALFHDRGKDFNADTLDKLIDTARCLGIDFISYDEALRHKEYLANTGVLQEAPKEENDILGSFIEDILNKEEHQKHFSKTCSDDHDHSFNTCLSSNGKTYQQCQGESSVCVNGQWLSKTDPVAIKRCGFRNCYSKYTKKTYRHCEGSNSICVNGEWLKKSKAKSICNIN
ncbi:MAG: hypothetical protein CME64_03305 [Halobacteriovoraceae bacterium]|nr:hypothetical protein [Halobacteriovoraceae bacterium]|tara:strand:+ start:69258 stop:70559 length:1302 start_codon:yes stop_codon:yes gene_type:complete